MLSSIPVSVSDRYVDALEDELQGWLRLRPDMGRHYDMLAYHMGWTDESLAPRPGPRGKRFRPIMCLLSCEAVGGEWRSAVSVAAALEFLHNFSLIHDDIEDHDESRHHRPTLWKLYGDPLAINAGDAMLALAGLAALSSRKVPGVAVRFQETALALTEGQYLDMTFETEASVSVDEYFHMIELKTAALICCACQVGGMLGRGSEDQTLGLQKFGEHFGLAYQVFDDLRGIWAATADTGKVEGKDIVNRKKSLPVLLALDRATGADRKSLVAYYVDRADAEPSHIAAIVEDLQVRREIEAALRQHLDSAFEALNGIAFRSPYVEELKELATRLVRTDAD